MPIVNRDSAIVEHILRYCHQVETAHQDFGHSKDRFAESTTYQNAVSMCILHIHDKENACPIRILRFGRRFLFIASPHQGRRSS